MNEKKFVNEAVASIKEQLDGYTLEQAIVTLIALRDKHGPSATIDIGQESEPYCDSEYAFVRIKIRRLETDEEFDKRVKIEEQWVEQRRIADLAAYERVKKSLEGK